MLAVQAGAPSRETLQGTPLVDGVIGVGRECFQPQIEDSSQCSDDKCCDEQLLTRNASDHHHQKDDKSNESRGGEVLRHNEHCDDKCNAQYGDDGFFVGCLFSLTCAQNECYCCHHNTFGQFRGLKGEWAEGNPSCTIVKIGTCYEDVKEHKNDGGKTEDRDELEEAAGEIMDTKGCHSRQQQEKSMMKQG